MASDSITGCILIQEQLEQVDMFPCLGSIITENGECMMEFDTRLNRAGDRVEGKVTAYRFQPRLTNESSSVACSNARL